MTMSHFTFIGLSVVCVRCTLFHVSAAYLHWAHKIRFFFVMMKRLKWPPVNVILSVLNTSTRTHNIKANKSPFERRTHAHSDLRWVCSHWKCTLVHNKEFKEMGNNYIFQSIRPIWIVEISFQFLWHSTNALVFTSNILLSASISFYNSLWIATRMLPWSNHSTIKSLINVKKKHHSLLWRAFNDCHVKFERRMSGSRYAWVRVVQCACSDFSSLKCTAIKI